MPNIFSLFIISVQIYLLRGLGFKLTFELCVFYNVSVD